jgi:ABC-type phosphate transport system substrate-binding protein
MRIGKKIQMCLVSMALGLFAHAASPEVVVIVSNKNPTTILRTEQVADIFLGQSGNFPEGTEAVPIDQAVGSATRDEFYSKVAGKSSPLMKAYWSKLIFTGRGQPPKEVSDNAAMKKLVAENPHLIGYIDKSAFDTSVKAVMTVR